MKKWKNDWQAKLLCFLLACFTWLAVKLHQQSQSIEEVWSEWKEEPHEVIRS